MNVINVSAKIVNHYGNLNSGIMASTLPKPDARAGDEATILRGRDRDPAKVLAVVLHKRGKNAGRVKGFILQAYNWTMDPKTEGYASAIHWDRPAGEPTYHEVKRDGTVEDAFIGSAQAFYDRSF